MKLTRIAGARFALALLIVAPLVVIAADKEPTAQDLELQAVLDRFDEVQSTIRTLAADLKMTTHNKLLKEPVIYRGRFYMTKPDSVRWEFNTPEEMRFVIANDQYVGYYPEQKRAERKSIKRWSTQLFRYFGLGQGSEELSKFYRISMGREGGGDKQTHLLVMEPRKRRARKRIDDVRFWVDRQTMLPVRVEYHGTDGNYRIVEFRDMRLNVELAAGLYDVAIPPDVEVSTGFTPFGNEPDTDG